MKRILITGNNSYIAKSFKLYVESCGIGQQFEITLLSVRNEDWKEKNFGEYDVILHCAGIVHQKENEVSEEEYYRVNRELTRQLAVKAKAEGVRQFLFISTMNVYGVTTGIITADTEPAPCSFYGKSKLEAENILKELQDEKFKVCIIRPPMIYGKNSRGNYQRLAKLAQKLPIFPDVCNERSMLYIDNLCEFLRLLIEYEEAGIFFPQNTEYVNTSEMVRSISKMHGREIKLTKVFNPVLHILSGIGVISKVFGSLVYEKKMSNYEKGEYRILNFKESIRETENY